jgi:phosphatidylserine synthase
LISSKIGHSLDPLILRVYQLFFRGKPVKPNLLTVVGLLFGFICLILTINNRLLPAGLALFVSGFFDLLDGAVARQYGFSILFWTGIRISLLLSGSLSIS